MNQILESIIQAYEADTLAQLDLELAPEQLSGILESLPESIRIAFWHSLKLDSEEKLTLLDWLEPDVARNLLEGMSQDQQEEIALSTPEEYISEAVEFFTDDMRDTLISNVSDEGKSQVQTLMDFNESQVGRFIDFNIATVYSDDDALGYSRSKITHYDSDVQGVFVNELDGALCGYLGYSELLRLENEAPFYSLAKKIPQVSPEVKLKDVLHECDFNQWTKGWVAVVQGGRLMGVLWLSYVMEALQEDVAGTAIPEALKENDIFAPVNTVAKQRSVWLCINLVTAFMASAVISMFEVALAEVVALAVLMPVVASMGGIAGSQTLSVAIRGLAMGNLSQANMKVFLQKELRVAIINGIAWSVLIGIISAYWFSSPMLGVVITIAIVMNSVAAAFSGVFFPYLLEKMNVDPAISGSVILTTVTDVVGFFVFLGLGSLILV